MNMAHTLFLAPVGSGCGLTSISLGLFRALDNHGIRVAFYKPIGQPTGGDDGPERSTHFIRATTSLHPSAPIPLEEAERLIGTGHLDELLERVVRAFHESAANADVCLLYTSTRELTTRTSPFPRCWLWERSIIISAVSERGCVSVLLPRRARPCLLYTSRCV